MKLTSRPEIRRVDVKIEVDPGSVEPTAAEQRPAQEPLEPSTPRALERDEKRNLQHATPSKTHGPMQRLLGEKSGLPDEARALAAALELGKPVSGAGAKKAALARLVERFGPLREPGVEVLAFERGAVYREKGGAAWRPVPNKEQPIPYVGLEVQRALEKKALGHKTWAHDEGLTRAQLDELVSEMRSHTGPIKTDPETGLPQNPLGPTGVTGRGESNLGPILAQDILLHARDPSTGKRYAVFIERKDTGRWAMPGGIEDAKDKGAKIPTAIRELFEETGVKGAGGVDVLDDLMRAFASAKQTYQGVCAREPRNTDNMWFETTVFSVEIPWELARSLVLEGGDDAKGAALKEVTRELVASLHGDHPQFVAQALATA